MPKPKIFSSFFTISAKASEEAFEERYKYGRRKRYY
jgi:hypothetical protein